jgi:hypothetical protein
MWILHFFPDSFIEFIVHAVLLAGAVGMFLTFVIPSRLLVLLPVLAPYHRALQAISVLFLCAGIYLAGGHSVEQQWRERVREVEAKLAVAEQQSQAANAALNTKSQEKIKYIQGRNQVITQYIDREVVRYDTKFAPGGECEIPQEFVKAHNSAAQGITK